MIEIGKKTIEMVKIAWWAIIAGYSHKGVDELAHAIRTSRFSRLSHMSAREVVLPRTGLFRKAMMSAVRWCSLYLI